MRASGIIVLFLLLGWATSIRITDIQVPAHVAEGKEALLGCQFEMEGDTLYSVKWYKDGREFFRYVPKNKETVNYFLGPGIIVDRSRTTLQVQVWRSSNVIVQLVNLTQESQGIYKCEVSGEGPKFTTVSDEKHVNVYLIPESGPQITGLDNHYGINERVFARCTSAASKPEAILKWIINGQSVSEKHQRRPWYKVSANRPNVTQTVIELNFTVKPHHYKDGVMELKCQATIAPLYQQETTQRITEWLTPIIVTEENDHKDEIFSIPDNLPVKVPDNTNDNDVDEQEPNHESSIQKPLATLFLTVFIIGML